MHLDLDIHNYYEHLVIEYISSETTYTNYDMDLIADICCLALSRLPSRYIRHQVDMAFYLSSAQRTEMTNEVRTAVNESRDYLREKINAKESV